MAGEEKKEQQPVSATASPTPDTVPAETPTLTEQLKTAAKHVDGGTVYAEFIYLPGHKGEQEKPRELQKVPAKGEKIRSLKFENMPKGAIGWRTYTQNTVTAKLADGKEIVAPQPRINISPDTLYIGTKETGDVQISDLTGEYVATRRVTGKVHRALKADMEALDVLTLRMVPLKDVLGRKILIEGSDIKILKPDSKEMAPTLISAKGLTALIVLDESDGFVVVPLNSGDIIKDSSNEDVHIVPPAPIRGTPTKEIELFTNPVKQHKGPWTISTAPPESGSGETPGGDPPQLN
ncbi:MAG: hypothetical protein DHS20C02_13970 [Micavibrio sp.]|nr:MAG: hypothetical protein DHS20C02_13970 [Micavibrio sp.]